MKYRYFWLSFSVAFFILAITFFLLMLAVHPEASPSPALVEDEGEAYSPTREDGLTVLFVGVTADSADAGTFLLSRFDPLRGQVPLVVFPRQTLLTASESGETLAEAYRHGGAEYARDKLAATLGITIDRYVRMDASAFIIAADAVGTVEYDLDRSLTIKGEGDSVLVLNRGTQLVDGRKAANIIRYRDYTDGELGRCSMISDFAASVVNQRIDVALSTVVDKLFEKIINLVTSDISYVDYDNRKEAARYLADQEEAPALPITVAGQWSPDKDRYTLSDTFIALMTQTFS